MRKALVVLCLVAAGCGTKKNPEACCTDEVDCANVGLPVGSTCDDGRLCRGNRCVEESCGTTADCDATAPYCVITDEGRCAEQCTADSQCPGFNQTDERFCVGGACVDCRAGMNDCPNNAPVCSPEGQCVTCLAHTDCATGVCANGTCATEDEVAYVATNGSPASDCTQTTPCNSVDRALLVLPARQYVLIESGTYSNTTAIAITGTRWLIGRGTARPVFTRSTDGPIMFVSGTVDAKLEHIEVFGARGSSAGVGVQCVSPGAPKIELLDVVARMNEYAGFSGGGCAAKLTRSAFTDNARYGISNGEGSSIVDRCSVINNADTGIFVDGGIHAITNVVVARNGSRGIDIYSQSNGNRVEFNTIVDNGHGSVVGMGIQCNLLAINGTHPNNIIARNEPIQTSGCQHPNSIIVDTDIAPIKFVRTDAPPYDYHIQGGSLAIDAGTTTTIKVDFDGESRPFGGGNDVGADELH